MKVKKALFVFLCVLIYFGISSWGFYGHRRINRMAVLSLPPEMIGFYKANIEFITAHAIDPDKRRYASKNEAPRHYIDIDHYAKEGGDPFKLMPRYWKDAVEKYTEDTLKAYGIVPWHVSSMTYYLQKAFEERDANAILRLSADLGHYIADAHVPLHTTENYNGQMTGQKGIHGLWESSIPEIKADDYDYLVGRATYIRSPINTIWEAVEASHSHVEDVLRLEKELHHEFPSDQKYIMNQRGQNLVQQYSKEYVNQYDQRMGNMVEERMRKAIGLIGSYWYTAWVNAGQPNLTDISKQLDKEALEEEINRELKGADEKIIGRSHEN